MSLPLSECRRIIEGIFCRPDLPEELRSRFAGWMLAHEHDPALRQVMLEMWASIPDNDEDVSAEELSRLLNDIEALDGNDGKRSHRSAIKRWSAAAAMIAAVFAAGYLTSHWIPVGDYGDGKATTILVTAPGSTGHHTLPDGTEVWLNSDSRLSFTGNLDGDTRSVMLKGEAYFNVTKDPARPFLVTMDSLTVEVTGTAFDAINYPYAPEQIALRNGHVNITGIDSNIAVSLHPDQIVTRMRGATEMSVDNTAADNYCVWMTRSLIFDNRRLGDIITNIERRYAVNITVAPDVNLDKRLSLTISGETLGETSRLLQRILPIEISGSDTTVVIRNASH